MAGAKVREKLLCVSVCQCVRVSEYMGVDQYVCERVSINVCECVHVRV